MKDGTRAMVIAFHDKAAIVSSFDTDRSALKAKIDSIEPSESLSTLTEAMALAAVEMALELHPLLGERAAQIGERENLIPTAVGEDRATQAHEGVEPAEPLHDHLAATSAPVLIVGAGEMARQALRLVRTGDYYIPLRDRVKKGRELRADLFVSIHADPVHKPRNGSECFVETQPNGETE